MSNKKYSTRWSKSVQNNYGKPALTLVKGKGIVVTDADGKSYLDFLGGIATNILGHAHPAIVSAVTKQVATLSHVSNFYAHPKAIELAEKLTAMTGDKSAKVFFCQSGAEDAQSGEQENCDGHYRTHNGRSRSNSSSSRLSTTTTSTL